MRSGLCRVDVSMHSLRMQADTVNPLQTRSLQTTHSEMCVESQDVAEKGKRKSR